MTTAEAVAVGLLLGAALAVWLAVGRWIVAGPAPLAGEEDVEPAPPAEPGEAVSVAGGALDAFGCLVAEECAELGLPPDVVRGLEAKWGRVEVRACEEPDPVLHPEVLPKPTGDGRFRFNEVFGDFQGRLGIFGRVTVYRGPIERMAPETGLTTREHVRRVLLHEFAHAAGMSHEDLGPYGI